MMIYEVDDKARATYARWFGNDRATEEAAADYFAWRKGDDVAAMERQIREQAEEIARLRAEVIRLNYKLHRKDGIEQPPAR